MKKLAFILGCTVMVACSAEPELMSGTANDEIATRASAVLSPTRIVADPSGGATFMSVTADFDYEIILTPVAPTTSVEWLTAEKTEGGIILSMPANNGTAQRVADLQVKDPNSNYKSGKMRLSQAVYNPRTLYTRTWAYVATRMPATWYSSNEAMATIDNVLLYQRANGGWPKNVEIHQPLTDAQKEQIAAEAAANLNAIFDNGATTMEMQFIAKVCTATKNIPALSGRLEELRESVGRAVDFILEAQYDDTGGWPMFYPLRNYAYYDRITFNDNSMVNIMNVVGAIAENREPYQDLANEETVGKARSSFAAGIQCILDCQIIRNGQRTLWCAQHNEVPRSEKMATVDPRQSETSMGYYDGTQKPKYAPAYGRDHEHPSFGAPESKDIVLLLMSIEDPSADVIAAIQGAMAWFDAHRIQGYREESFVNDRGETDKRLVADPTAPDLWARCYHLELEVPIFGDYGPDYRQLTIYYDMMDIRETARRVGYQWYGSWVEALFTTHYPAWKAKHGVS